jgi:hypothetical protein
MESGRSGSRNIGGPTADTTSPGAVADVETVNANGERIRPGANLIGSLQVNKTLRGNAGVTFDVMMGIFGISVRPISFSADSHNLCATTEVCVKFGAGAYVGASASYGGGIDSPLVQTRASQDSWELFWDAGEGISTGGELLIPKGKLEYEQHAGFGQGVQGGVKFCSTYFYGCVK